MPWGKVFFNSWCKGMKPSRTSWVICWERVEPIPLIVSQFTGGDQFRNRARSWASTDPGSLDIGPDFKRVLPGQLQNSAISARIRATSLFSILIYAEAEHPRHENGSNIEHRTSNIE